MAEFPYMNATGKIEEFFGKIKSVGAPPSVTNEWLEAIGFTRPNDRRIKGVLEYIGFIDISGNRTSKWDAFLDNSKSETVMADAIREGYSSLFNTYSDAYQQRDEDLQTFFRASNPTIAANTVKIMVGTFKALCSMADFNPSTDNGADTDENGNAASTDARVPLVAPPKSIESPTPTLHIDFQVHIAADAPPEQIDQIFESMAKHLYGKVAE